ncbi:MAG TPA: thiol:disulfide interchange protein DsbA/DsbL [Steroidobacteraceae bacterium]|nr:thiol:disulfide interchange protein DsbA/DsbL [Steroidobacteraceae bacterium]
MLDCSLKRGVLALLATFALVLAPASQAAQTWIQGTHYDLITPTQPTHVAPGKVEVLEVFSFGCPVCNQFQPVIDRLEKDLPANAQMAFLPASFLPQEDWVVFQRGFFAAQQLGIETRTHQAIFDAIWETGELQTIDSDTHRIKNPLPSIEDVAKCYARLTGVKAETFLAAARSPVVEAKMKAADAQVVAMKIPGTPCIVVNGKYRINMDSLRDIDDLFSLVRYLVAKESRP